jgi:hypothetical protein
VSGTELALTIITAALAGAGTSFLGLLYNSIQERRERHRDHFSRALQAVTHYEEFPFVVHRRRASDAEGERIRISTELRAVQADLTYHRAWLMTESPEVGAAYQEVLTELRRVVGTEIHDAWLTPPPATDADMNIPGIAEKLAALGPLKETYLLEVGDHLSLWPRWLRRVVRRGRRWIGAKLRAALRTIRRYHLISRR